MSSRVNDIDPCFECEFRHHLCWNECEMYAAMKRRNDQIRENRKTEGAKWTSIWNRKTKDYRTGKNIVRHSGN